jgi:hypothetical protein
MHNDRGSTVVFRFTKFEACPIYRCLAKREAGWIFERSGIRRIWARSFPEWVEVRVADHECLFIMKFLTARKQDVGMRSCLPRWI